MSPNQELAPRDQGWSQTYTGHSLWGKQVTNGFKEDVWFFDGLEYSNISFHSGEFTTLQSLEIKPNYPPSIEGTRQSDAEASQPIRSHVHALATKSYQLFHS